MSKNLPKEWKECKFKDLFDLKQGKNLSLKELSDTGYSVFGANGKIGCYDEYMYDEKVLLVTCRGATCGSINLTEEKSWVTGNSIALIPKIKLDINFYKFYLRYISFRDVISGSAQPQIIVSKLNEKKIIEIPLEEQERIVSILERAESVIQKRKESNRLLDELVKSKFIEMFGDPVLNNKFWQRKKLEEYIEFLTSGSRGWSRYFSEDGEMFLTIKNVKNNNIRTDNMQYIIAPNTQEAKRTKVKEGDLLISITADLGRTGVVSKQIEEFGAYINQHLSLVRLDKEKVNPLYISYFLESEGGKIQFDAKNQVGVKSGLNFDAIKSLYVLVPPIEEQNKFIDFTKQVDKLKFEMENSLKELENNFNSLMQRAFNGELF